MRVSPMRALALMAALSLLPGAVAAQSDETDEAALPVLDGLAWYRSVDLTGEEIRATRPAEEVDAWNVMLDAAGGTFGDLDYAFYDAFDPATLPRLGSLATVRVVGAETDALHAAVVEDIIAQVEALDAEPPTPEPTSIAGRDVTVLGLPDAMGFETAIVYAAGDTAWVLLMPLDDATRALQQLP